MKKAVLIELENLSPEPPEDSDFSESEILSLSDSFVHSETESMCESVGSVDMTGCSEPIARLELGSPRRKKKGAVKFLLFTKEMKDVPVEKAWEFIHNDKMMASLVPGLIQGFDFIEGEGGTGSIYIANYNPKSLKPGDDPFLINKVEVNDEESKEYAVRCVGGRYMKIYNIYVTYVNVIPHHVDRDSSCIIVWRFEYELIESRSPPPEYTRRAYEAAMDMMRERHIAINRVERPFVVSEAGVVYVTKRLRGSAGPKRLTGADELQGLDVRIQQEPEDTIQQNPEDRSDQRRRRQRKVKGKGKARVNDDEGSDRGSRAIETPWWMDMRDF